MIKAIRESNLYIAISESEVYLDKKAKIKVNNIFKEIFEDSVRIVSEVEENSEVEIVYELQVPVMSEESLVKDFFENLEIVLEELREFNPHFTCFNKGAF